MYSIPDFAGSGGGSDMLRGGQFDFGSLGGSSSTSNQWMNFPSMTMPSTGGPLDMTSPPGVVPPAGGGAPNPPGYTNPGFSLNNPLIGGKHGLGGGATTEPTLDPNFTSQLYQWLQSMIGKGATPFDLSAVLPSGGTTTPGTLTAPENPILQALQEFYTKGTGGPLPGVLPMWQSEMKAMEIPIEQQMANIKEQFGSRGALGSSEMAQAMETFGAQTAADQEKLLGELTLQALPGMESAGMNLQQLDQGSIDRLVQEFIRTRPEYSPLLPGMEQLGTTFSPLYGHTGFGAAFGQSFGSGLGGGLATLLTGH